MTIQAYDNPDPETADPAALSRALGRLVDDADALDESELRTVARWRKRELETWGVLWKGVACAVRKERREGPGGRKRWRFVAYLVADVCLAQRVRYRSGEPGVVSESWTRGLTTKNARLPSDRREPPCVDLMLPEPIEIGDFGRQWQAEAAGRRAATRWVLSRALAETKLTERP